MNTKKKSHLSTKKILPFILYLLSYFSFLGTVYHTVKTVQVSMTIIILNEMRFKQFILSITAFNF